MGKMPKKTVAVLIILFFLPVVFLLFLYPAKHNYDPLQIVDNEVAELQFFNTGTQDQVKLEDQITILGFFGNNPLNYATAASNLKELVYDKFKGFKGFQIVILLPNGTEAQAKALHDEINNYEDMRFWHYTYGTPNDIQLVFNSLDNKLNLDSDLSSPEVFIIDKDLAQRGRLDDRTEREMEKNAPIIPLYSYDCIEVAEIKNKMNDDIRILFTEYRQKRKGDFDSSTRRGNNIKAKD
jgi:hypothetical protein